jgi:hypothetical protein
VLHLARRCSLSPTISTLRFRLSLCEALEFFGEGDVVEERPRVVELRVPRPLEVPHGLHHLFQLRVADKGEYRRIDSRSPRLARRIPFILSM